MNVLGGTALAGLALATGLTAAVAAPAPYAHVLLLSSCMRRFRATPSTLPTMALWCG
jgi:hypothetical protein